MQVFQLMTLNRIITVDFDFGGSIRDKWRQLMRSTTASAETNDLVDPIVQISLAAITVSFTLVY